jgi:Orotate phosphoribosyltransferase
MNAENFFSLINGRRGHFLYESGYHSDVWFDLETLCQRPTLIRSFLLELCSDIAATKPEVICGALIEGAFVALLTAMELQCQFVYTLRVSEGVAGQMFGVAYELPATLQKVVLGKRVAVVNDVISAGSAVRGTLQSLSKAGAEIACVGSLVVLGDSFLEFAEQQSLSLRTLLKLPNNLWQPSLCPLCAASVPLQRLAVQ